MVALKTFLNLDEARKEQIISASLEEFALHEYDTASLSNIVARLHLAKGSFYRYFESKQALYFFLLDHCADVRWKSDQDIMKKPSADFFELLLQHFKAKLQFDKKFPLHSAFLHNVMYEKNNDEIGNIRQQAILKIIGVALPEVKNQIRQKHIRSDIDTELLTYTSIQCNLSVIDYAALKFRIDFRKNIREGKPLYYPVSENEMIKIARKHIEILKNGIKNK